MSFFVIMGLLAVTGLVIYRVEVRRITFAALTVAADAVGLKVLTHPKELAIATGRVGEIDVAIGLSDSRGDRAVHRTTRVIVRFPYAGTPFSYRSNNPLTSDVAPHIAAALQGLTRSMRVGTASVVAHGGYLETNADRALTGHETVAHVQLVLAAANQLSSGSGSPESAEAALRSSLLAEKVAPVVRLAEAAIALIVSIPKARHSIAKYERTVLPNEKPTVTQRGLPTVLAKPPPPPIPAPERDAMIDPQIAVEEGSVSADVAVAPPDEAMAEPVAEETSTPRVSSATIEALVSELGNARLSIDEVAAMFDSTFQGAWLSGTGVVRSARVEFIEIEANEAALRMNPVKVLLRTGAPTVPGEASSPTIGARVEFVGEALAYEPITRTLRCQHATWESR